MYKLKYFHEQNWPADWIQTAEKILREQWRTKYKPTTSEDSEQRAVPEASVPSVSCFDPTEVLLWNANVT